MVIRLLPKREIDKAKAQDRALEVGEGKKLAQRVDDLRELVAKEELNLRNFREKTVAGVMAEVKTLTDRKEYLQADLEELERRRVIAKEPLDKEWLKIREKQAELAELTESLAAKEAQLAVLHEKHLHDTQALEFEKGRVADERERSSATLGESSKAAQEAREHLAQARNEAQAIISRAELKERSVTLREQDVSKHEEELIAQQDKLKKATIDLLQREDALRDKSKTLERSIQRIHG